MGADVQSVHRMMMIDDRTSTHRCNEVYSYMIQQGFHVQNISDLMRRGARITLPRAYQDLQRPVELLPIVPLDRFDRCVLLQRVTSQLATCKRFTVSSSYTCARQ